MFEKLIKHLPELPKFVSEVEIPVYLIHMDAGADDYFFLFDFEEFAEQSKQGLFVRPKLRLWAGRDDFSRSVFAGEFRQTFQTEFDRMRQDVNPKHSWWSMSWLPVWAESEEFAAVAAVFNVAQLVLWVALLGPKVLISLRSLLFGKKRRKDVEAKIAELRDQVDGVLQNVDVSLHPELYDRARALQGPVQRSRVEREAWPLPDYVREHLNDGTSGSWW